MKKIIIVEDQLMLLDSLRAAVSTRSEFRVIATLTSANDVLSASIKHRPDLVLMDICTENGASGIEATAQLRQHFPELKIVLMTAMPDISFVEEARQAGANSFIYKNIRTEDLLGVLRSCLDGYSTFPATSNISWLGYNELNDRELQILRMTCEGKTRKGIADILGYSENTIKAHISSILTKTGYRSIAQLALFMLSAGLIVVDHVEGAQSGGSGGIGGSTNGGSANGTNRGVTSGASAGSNRARLGRPQVHYEADDLRL